MGDDWVNKMPSFLFTLINCHQRYTPSKFRFYLAFFLYQHLAHPPKLIQRLRYELSDDAVDPAEQAAAAPAAGRVDDNLRQLNRRDSCQITAFLSLVTLY
jgi:hypothetical protein